jgi:hypothetical protein
MPAVVHTRPDHDETLIARLAAADLSGGELAEAQELVATCPACAELHADVRSIMAATAVLPAPQRTRDFQLTEADAARLRATGWRRLLGRFGDPRLAFTRPLATGLVTLGIAGLVLAGAPSLLRSASATGALAPVPGGASQTELSGQPMTDKSGAASSAPATAFAVGAASPAASTAAQAPTPPSSEPTKAPEPAPTPAGTAGTPPDLTMGAASAAPATDHLPPDNVPGAKIIDVTAPAEGPSPLLVASVALLVVGIGLFLIRWVARRPA